MSFTLVNSSGITYNLDKVFVPVSLFDFTRDTSVVRGLEQEVTQLRGDGLVAPSRIELKAKITKSSLPELSSYIRTLVDRVSTTAEVRYGQFKISVIKGWVEVTRDMTTPNTANIKVFIIPLYPDAAFWLIGKYYWGEVSFTMDNVEITMGSI